MRKLPDEQFNEFEYSPENMPKAKNNYDVITFRMYNDIQQLLYKLLRNEFEQHGSTKKTSQGQMLRQLSDECRKFYNFTNKLSNLCDCRCTKELICSCNKSETPKYPSSYHTGLE